MCNLTIPVISQCIFLSHAWGTWSKEVDVRVRVTAIDTVDSNPISMRYFLPWLDFLLLLPTCPSLLLHFQFVSSPTAAPAGFPVRRLANFTVLALVGLLTAGPDGQGSWTGFSRGSVNNYKRCYIDLCKTQKNASTHWASLILMHF